MKLSISMSDFVVVGVLFYVHGKQLGSCRDYQLTLQHFSWIDSGDCRCCVLLFIVLVIKYEIIGV